VSGFKPQKKMKFFTQAIVVVVVAFVLYYLPYFVLLFNSFTPFKIVHHPLWKKHMDWRRSFRPVFDPILLPEIDYKDLTYEKFIDMTANLSRPIVIRNAIKVDHLQQLSDLKFWDKNYGNSTINCIEMPVEHYRGCKVNEFLDYNLRQKRTVYSRTNHQILYENPELLDMLTNDVSKWIGSQPLYEIFIGFKEGGSPLHAAFGVNLFKQITGSKKWTLWAPAELPFMDLHLTDDAASLLAIGGATTMSDAEWVKRTRRYEATVNAGDMLFNPCMWMHVVENLPGSDPLGIIIGSPERHFGLKYGWKTSTFVTSHLVLKKILIKIYQRVNGIKAQKSALDFLPVQDAASAQAFDEYIRARAIELTGAELK
jgi:hypothetical protein